MKTAVYVRVSTTQQIDRESLQTQEERLRQYCKIHSHSIYKVYREEGVSAKDIKRPKLEELMQDIENKKIQVVLVAKLDRITRSLKDLINLIEFFQEHDVKLISLTQNIDTTGSMGRFMLNLLGAVAQVEREMTAERVSEDMHHRALAGKWNGGIIPYGYTTREKFIEKLKTQHLKEEQILKQADKLTPDGKKLFPDSEEASLVRRIYQLYLEHKSLRRLTHWLNTKGYRTRKGKTWATPSIRRILINPTYTGKMWYGKRKTDLITGKLNQVMPEKWKIVKGQHEAIVSEDTFNRIQKLLKSRFMKPTKAQHVYLLSGLLRCGKCNGRMFGYTYRKKIKNKPRKPAREYFYYRCQNSIQKGASVCKGMVLPGQVIDETIVNIILSLAQDKNFLQDKEAMLKALRQEAKPSKPEVQDEKKRLVLEEQKLMDKRNVLLEKLENSIIDDGTFEERFNLLKRQLEAVRARQSELALQGEEFNLQEIALQASYEELCNLPKMWQHLNDKERQEKLRTIINHITVDKDEKEREIKLRIEIFTDSLKKRKVEKYHFVANVSRKPAPAGSVAIHRENAPVLLSRFRNIELKSQGRSLTESICILKCRQLSTRS